MSSIFFYRYRELFLWGWSGRKTKLPLTCILSYVYERVELYLHSNPLLLLFTGPLNRPKVCIRKFLHQATWHKFSWCSRVFKKTLRIFQIPSVYYLILMQPFRFHFTNINSFVLFPIFAYLLLTMKYKFRQPCFELLLLTMLMSQCACGYCHDKRRKAWNLPIKWCSVANHEISFLLLPSNYLSYTPFNFVPLSHSVSLQTVWHILTTLERFLLEPCWWQKK